MRKMGRAGGGWVIMFAYQSHIFQRWIDVNAGLQPPDVRGKTGSWHVTQTADRLTVRPSR